MSMLRNKKRKIRPGLKQRRFRQRLITYRENRARRGPRRIPRAAVPSFFTLMNLFCGFLSMIQVMEGKLEYAGWLILLAALFDMMDGMMARLTNGTSLFGVELDSLADIVSFGVAPSFMIYAFGLNEFGTPGIIISALPAMAGAVRLARFNVDFEGEKKEYFTGLPIPMSAMFIVAVILNPDVVEMLSENGNDMSVILIAVILLSGLMVSNIPFDSVPRPSVDYIRGNVFKSLIYLSSVFIMVFMRETGLLIVMVGYLCLGLLRAVLIFVQAVRDADLPSTEKGHVEPFDNSTDNTD